MSEATDIAITTIIQQRIMENTANSEEVETELLEQEDELKTSFFGELVTQKELDFFLLTSAKWNYRGAISKGNSTKRPFAQCLGYNWVYNFLLGSTPSNATSVSKTTPNSETVSVWPQKNKLKSLFDFNISSQRNIIYAQLVEIWATCTVASGQITFIDTQQLSVGDTVMISGVEYVISSEDTEGLVYTLTTLPADGTARLMYEYDFTEKVNQWPKLSFAQLDYAISYR